MFKHPASLFHFPNEMSSTTQTICIKQHFGSPGHRSMCADIACLPLSRRAQVLKHLEQFHGSPSRASRKPVRSVLADPWVGFTRTWLCNPCEHQTSAWIAIR